MVWAARLAAAWWVLLQAESAWAQQRPGDEGIDRGLELRRQGRDEDALVIFRHAAVTTPSDRAQAYVALTCAALGRWVEAYRNLTEVLARGGRWVARNRAQLEEKLGQVEAHIGFVEIRGGADGAVVTLDGERVATLPLTGPLAVPVGTSHLEVAAPGYLPVIRTVVTVARGRTRETINMVRAPPDGAGLTSVASRPVEHLEARTMVPDGHLVVRSSRSTTAAWVTGATGLAAVGLGVVASIVQSGHSDYLLANGVVVGDRLVRNPGCADCYERQEQQDLMHWLSIGGYIAGGALLGTSVVLVAVSRSSRPRLAGVSCLPSWSGVTCGLAF